MSWTHLPTSLRHLILKYHLASPEAIDHTAHIDNLVCGDLEVLISTNNTELVRLALKAYYASNIFVVKMDPTLGEHKIFRPCSKHALLMRQLVDEVRAPESVDEKRVGKRKDSGACLRDSMESNQGSVSTDDAASTDDAESARTLSDGADSEPEQEMPWYWELHRAKLERTLGLARALEKMAS